MATWSSNLADNLTEGIHKTKCKGCDYFLECENVKDNLIKCKCLSCNKDYSNKIDVELKKQFKNKDFKYRYQHIDFVVKKRCLFLWVHGWLGKV